MFYIYDEQGFYIEPSLEQVENSTDIAPPQPCWKPRWDGEKWVEEATEEEMNPTPAPQPPSDSERIEALENAVLELMLNV